MPRAVLIGGTGLIGRAAARALAEDGWDVVAVSRSGTLPEGLAELGVESVVADRADDTQLRAALGAGADVLYDSVAMNREHGEQLNGLDGLVGSLVVISTGSVYADDAGRALDGEGGEPPVLPVPIPETQRTAEPGDATYSTQKAELEQTLLEGPLPATLVRACAIHGPGAKNPRELFFVKRAVDGRRRVALAWKGESRFHTTSVANLAELIRLAASQPGDRVLNCGDPDPPTTLEICRDDRSSARPRVRAGPASGRRLRQPVGGAASVRRLDGGGGARARLPAGDDVPRGGEGDVRLARR